MKRSDFFIRLTMIVLFLAVVSYIGVYVYNAMINTYVTTIAFSYTIEETFPAQGYIVRTETVLPYSDSAVLPIVSEGAKVASGQALAVEYTSREALETANEIRSIRLKIAQLGSSSANTESAGFESVLALSKAVQRGDLGALDELSLGIETYVFSDGAAAGDDLPALQARLALLESRSDGLSTLYAPASGIFSQTVDGFEYIGPGTLSGITPSKLTQLFAAPSAVYGVGKLVTEFSWYYAAVIDAADAPRLAPGKQVPVQFSGSYNTLIDMRVESVGKQEDGQCVVLFSCERSVHDIAPLRFMRADVIVGAVSGIRVPKEAIHLDDDGVLFIFLETGVRAERVDVEVLLDVGDSYIVREGAETGTPLREGSTIIVKANNLFHGKIVA